MGSGGGQEILDHQGPSVEPVAGDLLEKVASVHLDKLLQAAPSSYTNKYPQG